MRPLYRRPVTLWLCGLSCVAVSLTYGGLQVASASTSGGSGGGGATTNSPLPTAVTANQGAAGSTSWPVKVTNLPATQPVSGTVSVSNLPATQPVSGSVSVSNLPATQPVSGTVEIGNGILPVEGSSEQIWTEGGRYLGPNDTDDTGQLDTSHYRATRLYISCVPTVPGDCANVTVTLSVVPPGGSTKFVLDTFSLSDYGTVSKVEDLPGPDFDVQIYNTNATDGVGVSTYIVGSTI